MAIFRPNKFGQHRVVGQGYLHGFVDTEAFLGSLPSCWETKIVFDFVNYSTFPLFVNKETGVESTEDPRLGPVADDWQRLEPVRTAYDPSYYAKFRNRLTGDVMNSDPRMQPEELERRGVKLQTFSLV